jgi:hypothetical protein
MTVTFAMPIAPTSRSVEDTGELIDLGLDIVTAVAHPPTRGLTGPPGWAAASAPRCASPPL